MLLDYVYDKFSKYHPAFIKGFISTCIAFLVFQQMFFGSDESYKYINPTFRYWLNWIVGSLAIIANSIRDSVSAYYNDKQATKNIVVAAQTGNTEMLSKKDVAETI